MEQKKNPTIRQKTRGRTTDKKKSAKNRQIPVAFYEKNTIFKNGHKNRRILIVNKPKK
jgi:hypothetical protein